MPNFVSYKDYKKLGGTMKKKTYDKITTATYSQDQFKRAFLEMNALGMGMPCNADVTVYTMISVSVPRRITPIRKMAEMYLLQGKKGEDEENDEK